MKRQFQHDVSKVVTMLDRVFASQKALEYEREINEALLKDSYEKRIQKLIRRKNT